MKKIFRISDLQIFYLAFAAIFIFTGFVYNFLFFRLFHIKVEQFFTLQDYLASSIEKVYLIFIAILFAAISSHLARYIMRERGRLLHHRLAFALLCCIPPSMFIAGMFMVMKYSEPSGYFLLSFALYSIGDYILFKVVFKGDQDIYRQYFYLSTFIFYALLIASTVIYDRDAVLNKPMHSLKNYQIHFIRDVKIDPVNCIILEANSNYFFLYDKNQNEAYVIPKDNISYIEAVEGPLPGTR